VGDYVELSLPARAETLFLVRFHVAVAAAHIDLGVEDIDDLRLAVDELCFSLLSRSSEPHQRLRVSFLWDDSSVDVICKLSCPETTVTANANGSATGVLSADLSAHVLGALVDEHGMYHEDGQAVGWLRKKHSGTRLHA
jgi:hypothetical protein